MAPLAELSFRRGWQISGSDESDSAKFRHLQAIGITAFSGHRAENLPDDADLLVYSSAVPESNPERVKARTLGIRQCRRGEFLAEFAAGFQRNVAVTGTHGKSSITAALVSILRQCGKNPGFMIGAEVAGMPSCDVGDGDIFVTEADESDGTHKLLKNFLAVIPNIEDDHEWSLGGKAVLDENFRKTAQNSAKLIYYVSPECERLLGTHPDAVKLTEMPSTFAGTRGFQAANAFIAAQAAIILGCDREQAYQAAQNYPQVARRMTLHPAKGNYTVIEDYAHHPTEVHSAIELLRMRYPGAHLRILFQPHRFARLEKYFAEFAAELRQADSLYIAPVFAAWSESGKVDSNALAKAAGGKAVSGTFADWAAETVRDLPGNAVIAILGAGDIDKVIPYL